MNNVLEVKTNNNNEELRISSREVAEMLQEKKHSNMIRKIAQLEEKLLSSKMSPVGYWIESTYKDGSGKENKEYLVSKKGCEFLAHKSTGNKGVAFTLAYMNKFDAMEKALQEIAAAKSIVEEVLPSYMIEDPIARAETWIKEYKEKALLLEANETLKTESEDKSIIIEDMKPKAAAFDLFLNSDTTYSVNAIAKGMAIKSMGRNNMYKYLRLKGVLIDGTREPYARYINNGYTKAVELSHIGSGNNEYKELVVRFTPKGVEWLYKSLKKDGYIKTKSLEDIVKEIKGQK